MKIVDSDGELQAIGTRIEIDPKHLGSWKSTQFTGTVNQQFTSLALNLKSNAMFTLHCEGKDAGKPIKGVYVTDSNTIKLIGDKIALSFIKAARFDNGTIRLAIDDGAAVLRKAGSTNAVSDALLNNLRMIVEIRKKQVKTVEQSWRAGRAKSGDVMEAKVALAQAENDLIRATQKYQMTSTLKEMADRDSPNTKTAPAIKVHRVTLPDMDEQLAFLDLASGKMIVLSDIREPNKTLSQQLNNLKQGDLGFDRKLGILRNGTISQWDGQVATLLKAEREKEVNANIYDLPAIPCRLLVTTSEGKKFDVKVLKKTKEGGLEIEYHQIKVVKMRRVTLPDADTKGIPTILDLASGQMFPIPQAVRSDTLVAQHFKKLGKGDLWADRVIGTLRHGTVSMWDGKRYVPFKPTDGKAGINAYQLPTLPCRLLVTTPEHKQFEVTVLSRNQQDGLELEYKPYIGPAVSVADPSRAVGEKATPKPKSSKEISKSSGTVSIRDKANYTRAQLNVIRTAIAVYQMDTGQYPSLEKGWAVLTEKDTAGKGPYMKTVPTNTLTGGTKITADTSGDWHYDPATKTIKAIVPLTKSQVKSLGLTMNDVVLR